MSDFIAIAKTVEVPAGTVRRFSVDGRKIAVYHLEKGFFASDNTCPHRGGPLAEGDIIGDEIVCPTHCWSFNIITGKGPVDDDDVALLLHQVRVEGDTIFVKLTASETGSLS